MTGSPDIANDDDNDNITTEKERKRE
jgi:hypothetical protein